MNPFARGFSSVLDITASAVAEDDILTDDKQNDNEIIAHDWTVVGALLTSAIYGAQSSTAAEDTED